MKDINPLSEAKEFADRIDNLLKNEMNNAPFHSVVIVMPDMPFEHDGIKALHPVCLASTNDKSLIATVVEGYARVLRREQYKKLGPGVQHVSQPFIANKEDGSYTDFPSEDDLKFPNQKDFDPPTTAKIPDPNLDTNVHQQLYRAKQLCDKAIAERNEATRLAGGFIAFALTTAEQVLKIPEDQWDSMISPLKQMGAIALSICEKFPFESLPTTFKIAAAEVLIDHSPEEIPEHLREAVEMYRNLKNDED